MANEALIDITLVRGSTPEEKENDPIYVQVAWEGETKVMVRQNPEDDPARILDAIRILAKALMMYGSEENPYPTVMGQLVERSLDTGLQRIRYEVNQDKAQKKAEEEAKEKLE